MVINLATIDFCPGQGGGSDPVIRTLDVTENGTYSAPAGVDGYSPVNVNVSGGGLTPEQEDAIDVIIDAGDGYLKHTPSVPVIGAREAILTIDGRQQDLSILNGDVYLHKRDNRILYKFNKQTYQFEEGPQTSDMPQNEHLWTDSQGRVYSNNTHLVDLETGVYTYKEMGGDFQMHTGSNFCNIIKKDGVVYMISESNACAFIFNEETQEFDSSIPIQGTFPASNFYRYLSEFEGHWIYDVGSTQTELVFHLDAAEPYAEWVELSERLFPGAWSYEYEGQTINETTRGVYVHPVTINGVKEYYNWGYRNPVMYKLVDGAWEIVPFTMNVDGYTSYVSGAYIDDLWFGYGYVSGTYTIIMWNFGEAKSAPDSYTWEQIDLSSYATQQWVEERGYITYDTLSNYVEDPQHHLNLTGNIPLVDGKEIANTDMCIVNKSYSYPGKRFEGVAGFSGMSELYYYYFVTPSGRLIYTNPGFQLAYEFNGTQWVQLQSVTTFIESPTSRVYLNDGLYVVNSNDYGLYRWDDTNSDWVFIIQAPDAVIWAADANTLRCSNNQKLVNNGGTYQWEEDWVNDYPSQGSLRCAKLGQNYYYMANTAVYTYDETQKTFTLMGNTFDKPVDSRWFTFNGCLYYFTYSEKIRKVDPSQVGTDQWDTATDIYYTGWEVVYVEYDSKIWTVKNNNSLGYNQLGYTYNVTASAPAVPAQDGTYVLKATVLNGQVTYSWVPEV